MIPLPDVVGIDAETVGDAAKSVAFTHAITDQPAFRFRRRQRCGNDQLVSRFESSAAFEVVGLGDGHRRDMVFLGDGIQRLSRLDAMMAPADPLLRGNIGKAGGKFSSSALREPQNKVAILRCG
jgi:hypothetical protein